MTTIDEKRDLLCRAITERLVIQFKYDGRMRIVEPFCCGAGSAGNYLLRGFQIRGADKTKPLCWRLYEISDMSQLNVTQHNFNGKRAEYEPNDSAFTQTFCCI
ncbi:MAG TPA: hypothetical protein PKY82_00795 [Pyrinomonadaceae bacterium]|nr:hypothetical protein [Pyrinomonadaceae bacterium]